jgi:polyisoprenoid-binding protein YceI
MLLLASTGGRAQGVLIDKSEIRFACRQMGASVEGRFRRWKANVDFRPKALAKSKADFEIDLSTIDLANDEFESEARRPRWFDTARFPVASFQSTTIKALADDRYEITGRLTLKGITRDCTLPVELTRDAAGNTIATGQFTFKRLDYQVGDGPWSDPSLVAHDVTVRVRMVLPRVA